MSSHDNSLDALLEAARDRQSPWDTARGNRVLAQALVTRATRARNKARRITIATACGAVLLLGFGVPTIGGGIASNPSANAAQNANHTETAQESPTQENIGAQISEPPSASELAALARNDGGYGRD